MKNFTCVQDLGDLKSALKEAFEIKKDRFKYVEMGKNKTLMMIFFNSSLRTRLSTQKAGLNLGMNVIVLDINQGAWKLETERGVIMDGDKPEHLLEAIPVMGCYCEIFLFQMLVFGVLPLPGKVCILISLLPVVVYDWKAIWAIIKKCDCTESVLHISTPLSNLSSSPCLHAHWYWTFCW